MIITIGGLAGSGKSTIAKKLSEKLSWPMYGMGTLRRQKAIELGMTLAEYNKLGETDPETDLVVDHYQEELGKTQDNFVIEGRTSWHFIPQAIKIFLTVNELAGAERIFKAGRLGEDKNLNSVEDVIASNRARLASDRVRYQKYLGVDVYDESHYDLVVDTTNLTPDEVLSKVYSFVENKI